MRRIFCLLPVMLLLLFGLGLNPAYSQIEQSTVNSNNVQIVRARVLESRRNGPEYLLTVRVAGSPYNGQVLQLPYLPVRQTDSTIVIRPGDEMLLTITNENGQLKEVRVSDYVRDQKLLHLTAVFVLLLIVLGGKKGVKAIISLAITGGAIFFIMLPLLFQGHDPIITTIIVSAAVSIITLFIIAGKNRKTLSAIIGTTGGVIVAGTLALIAGTAAQLTGFSDEEMQTLLFIPQQMNFNYQGILFAGMIIGALGAVMDVGMSIASAVEEIKNANPSLGIFSLIRAGMNVGRDIMGTMANTLILAYTGGAIPLMLVFMAYQTPLIRIINLDLIATEIVRALTGSIGLIAAVPITAVAAAILLGARP